MISYVKGEIAAILEDKVIIETGGIGFGLYMPMQSLATLPPVGNIIKIHSYMHVKEDGIKLFGFLTADDLEIFRMLIAVNGIGPKGGLQILSQMSTDALRIAVLSGDTTSIAKTPGIGKKTAEKLIIELRDKLKLIDVFQEYDESNPTSSFASDASVNPVSLDAVQALVALGYENQEALQAVRKVPLDEDSTVEGILKQAFKHIAR